VESTYAAPLPASRWRTATLVAVTLAIVEAVVLVAIGVAVLGKSVAHDVQAAAVRSAMHTPAAAKQAAPGKPKLMREETHVLVLNGSGVSGAAGTAAERLRMRNYRIADVTNAREQSSTTRTLVMYRKGYRAEAARLAGDIHTRIVTPLDGIRPRALMGAQVVLVVGT
jgi:hypothetical protein